VSGAFAFSISNKSSRVVGNFKMFIVLKTRAGETLDYCHQTFNKKGHRILPNLARQFTMFCRASGAVDYELRILDYKIFPGDSSSIDSLFK